MNPTITKFFWVWLCWESVRSQLPTHESVRRVLQSWDSWDFASLVVVYGGPQLSRQNQKPHGKDKNVTAKPKTSRQKQNPKTSRQNQILQSKSKIALVLPWVFAFAVRYLVFAVKYLVLPWGLWFCREGFGFVVRYFVFAVRFLFLPWGFRFCREVFCFCREVFGFAVRYFVFAMRFLVLPWQLWATVVVRIQCLQFCNYFTDCNT